MTTGQRMVRRSAGVLAGLVLAGATVGIGTAHADDIVWGCPSGYTLDGDTCRGANGSTTGALGLLPGDLDPVTGQVLLPLTTTPGSSEPSNPPSSGTPSTSPSSTPPSSTPPSSSETPSSVLPSVLPSSTSPAPRPTSPAVPAPRPTSPVIPPVVVPCPRPGTAAVVGNAEVVRTAAAVDAARARLAADIRRGAPPATIAADGRALADAIRAHAAALSAQRSTCPTR
ncbi:hypothetical protein [Actinomycetospora soli]|uniref:hypothetical protein n=1 Tax=Actinomycetospora soli TaxID=2893887 RepID=UPI001E4D63AC|nr:hypothetical protein [Actinomycetospora soli]MCD2187978.1 hypothetical protein [Actinomycetospora soli]